MKTGMIVKLLWKRHWWEAFLFVGLSLLLSGLLLQETGGRFYKGLAWIEVAALVWLVTRVSLTQLGFGTFGGWQSRPEGRIAHWIGEILFLAVPLTLAAFVRLGLAIELLQPSRDDWPPLIESWAWISFYLIALYTGCKILGVGWEGHAPRTRTRFAWGVILTLITGSLALSDQWGQKQTRRGEFSHDIDPRMIHEVQDWQWLRTRYNQRSKVEDLDLIKIPLQLGAVSTGNGLQIKLIEMNRSGETMMIRIEATASGASIEELPVQAGFMIAFQNGYFGGMANSSFRDNTINIPLLKLNRMVYSARLYSPLSLPENELSPEELFQGAELFVSIGKPESPEAWTSRARPDSPENDEEALRWAITSYRESPETKAQQEKLHRQGLKSFDGVLAAAPWSEWGAREMVYPYLVKFAGESEIPRLLELLKRDPSIADVFLEKGWSKHAGPILRKHLESGKTLTQRSVVYLAKLGEVAIGPLLENQLLRMRGNFGDAAKAVRAHPGVNWDRVRRTAWAQMESGLDRHRLWAAWGAEIGEKEALRILLVEAHSGDKWERSVLEYLMGGNGDVVKKLRDNWEAATFIDGRWKFIDETAPSPGNQ